MVTQSLECRERCQGYGGGVDGGEALWGCGDLRDRDHHLLGTRAALVRIDHAEDRGARWQVTRSGEEGSCKVVAGNTGEALTGEPPHAPRADQHILRIECAGCHSNTTAAPLCLRWSHVFHPEDTGRSEAPVDARQHYMFRRYCPPTAYSAPES